MKVGLPFCKQQVECLNVYQNQLLKILDWTCETGAPMFLLTKKPFFLIGILILSQLIVGIAVENLNSTPRSRIISRPMMISYSSVFCLGVLSTLKLWTRLWWGLNSINLQQRLMVVVVKDPPRVFHSVCPCSSFWSLCLSLSVRIVWWIKLAEVPVSNRILNIFVLWSQLTGCKRKRSLVHNQITSWFQNQDGNNLQREVD